MSIQEYASERYFPLAKTKEERIKSYQSDVERIAKRYLIKDGQSEDSFLRVEPLAQEGAFRVVLKSATYSVRGFIVLQTDYLSLSPNDRILIDEWKKLLAPKKEKACRCIIQ